MNAKAVCRIYVFRALQFAMTIATLVLPPALPGQTDCEQGSGPVNTRQPQGITPAEIIQRFAAREAVFKQARDNYTYTQELTVQTLDGRTVDGEYKQITDVTYDKKGNRVETVTFAPQPTLTRVAMTAADFDDIRNRMPFVMTTADLPQYEILYVGTQHVDEIETYVFDVAPKHVERDKRYFTGRIWVDDQGHHILKTCGKSVPEIHDKNNENSFLRFVTYREQIDGQYWFPTYIRADDLLHSSTGDVHIRATLKYTNYTRFGSMTRIIFKDEAPREPSLEKKP
jgi:hypothetical protein